VSAIDLLLAGPFIFNDFEIVESLLMVHEARPDWSGCRSRPRAERRWKKLGIQGRMNFWTPPRTDIVQMGTKLIMHPIVAQQLREQVRMDPPR